MYNLGIKILESLLRFFSRYNEKARLMTEGRKGIFERIEKAINPNERIVWVHAASLGEFEQGRPIIEALRETRPELKIFLTFYSPSGYEVRKDYKGADYIFYLPSDTKKNVKKFINLLNIEFVIYVKYEYWKNYLDELKKQQIPVYLISAIFNKSSLFFKFYGGWYRKLLDNFEHIFVQDKESVRLLKKIKKDNVTLAGDTRFDRVFQITQSIKTFELVEKFSENHEVFIIGSSWLPDEEIIFDYLNSIPTNIKFIIAPHEVHETNILRIISSLEVKVIRYSKAKLETIAENNVLIIDNIGMLSSLFQYGNLAYIGGGFGVGIHNILEPASFGLPVIFGPKYKKFKEAVDLVKMGGAFPIEDYYDFKEIFETLTLNKKLLQETSKISRDFIVENRGATQIIMKFLKTKF